VEIERHFVELEGGRVSYLMAGRGSASAGPSVLLIHGSGVSARSWVHQLRGVGSVRPVVAIDLPGHGESEPTLPMSVEDYSAIVTLFVEALGMQPIIAVGHSLGGAIAITLAASRPDLVRGLVIVSSCATLPWREGPGERSLRYLPGPVRTILFFAMARKILFGPGASGGALRLGMRELRACRPRTIRNDLRAARAMDVSPEAASLEVPALVLCGSRDQVTPPASSQRLAALIRGSRLRILDGSGHMVLLEAPERVTDEIVRFASDIVPPAPAASLPAASGEGDPSIRRRFLPRLRALGRRLVARGRPGRLKR
jgi:3-oxoadipate enol-lactonase